MVACPNVVARNFWRTTVRLARRHLFRLAAGAIALPALSHSARAQSYPERPVRLIVGAAAGAPPDLFARPIAQWLSERLGRPFVIDNRPGAGGNIAIEAVARSAPDGYTLLLVPTSSAINATLYEKLSFNFIRDIAPVAGVARVPAAIEVNPAFAPKTVAEFIAYAKANPGKINYASAGNGTVSHVAAELFKMKSGVDLVHVPYRSTPPALTDLVGGQVEVMFDTISAAIEQIRAGRLRVLAVTTEAACEVLPGIPTVASFVPGFEASAWFGIGAPRGTPADVIHKLNREINAALADPKIKAQFAALAGAVLPGSPADFEKLIAAETEKWGKVVRASGARAE